MTAREFPLTLAALVSLGAVVLALIVGTDGSEQAALAARWTARVGFPIFILTYSASSLVRLWPNDLWKTVLRHRRRWGLAFAASHTVHLVALTSAFALANEWPSARSLIGGGLAYVLIYAMALTSNSWSQQALGVWWKRLHTVGIHWIWFIFAFSYFGRIMEPERMAQGLIFFPICVAALGLRLAAWAKSRRRRAAIA